MSNLTKEQQAAVESRASFTSIIAPPGSGKTHTLVERVKWLVEQGRDPQGIIIVTFTRKAAAELRERLPSRRWQYLGTLHGLAMRSRPPGGNQIATEREMEEIFGVVAKDFDAKVMDVAQASRAPRGSRGKMLERAVCQHLDVRGLISMDRVLVEYSEQEDEAFECMLVDEVQDASAIDWAIYSRAQHLTVVGDPCQAIYSWRGGSVEHWRRATRAAKRDRSVETYKLTTNFRSCHRVIEGANQMMGTSMVGSESAPDGYFGVRRFDTEQEEWDTLAELMRERAGETLTRMVLCRTNAQVEDARVQLGARGVKVAQEPARPSNLAVALAYCCERPHNLEAAQKLARCARQAITGDLPDPGRITRGLGYEWPIKRETVAGKVPAIYRAALEDPDQSPIEALEESRLGQEGVQVMTVHRAKGREADYCYVVGATDRRYGEDDEDGRVLFVGITRARLGCAVTSAKKSQDGKSTTAQRWAKH